MTHVTTFARCVAGQRLGLGGAAGPCTVGWSGAAAVPISLGTGTMHAAVAALAHLPDALHDNSLRVVSGEVPTMPLAHLPQLDAHYWLL